VVVDLPHATQVKLLRVLEERKVLRVGGLTARNVDVRFIAATHRDVERDASGGRFRSDLYYRLNGITLTVPPLRERRADIAPLAQRFLVANSHALRRESVPRISPQVQQLLVDYAWPGNIRELRNVIERGVLLCDGDELLPSHLPQKMTDAAPPTTPTLEADPRARLLQQIEDVERSRVIDALERSGHNQTKAAELLGISRRTLVTRLGTYDLPRPRRR
jgi:two-component system response regulator AtoC